MYIKIGSLLLMVAVLSACITDGGKKAPDNIKASEINVRLGLGYLQQSNMGQASAILTKALRQNPQSAAAHNAYAILQERLLQKEKAEKHYRLATELDPQNSAAANNYGTFLCRNHREEEAEKYFLRALKNPLYKTPEYAYTNAARCLLKIDQRERAKRYLGRALAAKSDFSSALIAMAGIVFNEGSYAKAKTYVDRFHRLAKPTAHSLWLAIRTELRLDSKQNVDALVQQLKSNFPQSKEYQSWLNG